MSVPTTILYLLYTAHVVCLLLLITAVMKKDKDESQIVTLETDKGNIIIELYPECAPLTVANFVKLIRAGFYDGLTFHRFVKNFVIQGGDPDGTGTGGPGWTIPGEFKKKKLRELMPLHEKGVLAMARKPSPDSAGSQFYICLSDDPTIYEHLNGNYTTFGRVIDGMDVVQSLRERDVMTQVSVKSVKEPV